MSQEMTVPQAQVANREIASTLDGRDITRGFTGELLIPYDSVLRNRGLDLRVYEQVASDPQVKMVLSQRIDAVIQAPVVVTAGGDRPIDIEAADYVRAQLDKIGWDNVTKKMLYGVFYGFSAAELLWEPEERGLGWKAVKVRNRRRFRFDKHGGLRLLTSTNMYPGEECPPPYFWQFATGADNDDEPYGLGLAHWLYWPVLFKRNGIKFWLIFLEKFGQPTAVGKYDANATTEEKGKLLAALGAIATDSGVIIPDGMVIELLEAARSGTADYQKLHDTMDETIAKVVLGQTMTSQDGSSEAQANVHMEVRQDIVKADSDLVCESFNLGPVRWMIEYNFPGAALPKVSRMLEEEEDTAKVAETDNKIATLGFKPTLQYVKEKYGDHWEVAAPRVLAPNAPAGNVDPNAPPASFALSHDAFATERDANRAIQQRFADAAVDLAAPWEKFIGPRVKELQTLLDETGSLELFRERLVELANAEPDAEFILALQKAGFVAQLQARVPKA